MDELAAAEDLNIVRKTTGAEVIAIPLSANGSYRLISLAPEAFNGVSARPVRIG